MTLMTASNVICVNNGKKTWVRRAQVCCVRHVRVSPVPLWWAQGVCVCCHWCSAEAGSDTAVRAAWPLPSCSASNIPAPSGLSPCSPHRLEPTHTVRHTHMKKKKTREKFDHLLKRLIIYNNRCICFITQCTTLWLSIKWKSKGITKFHNVSACVVYIGSHILHTVNTHTTELFHLLYNCEITVVQVIIK